MSEVPTVAAQASARILLVVASLATRSSFDGGLRGSTARGLAEEVKEVMEELHQGLPEVRVLSSPLKLASKLTSPSSTSHSKSANSSSPS